MFKKWCFMIIMIDFVNYINNQSSSTQCCYFEIDIIMYDSKQINNVKFTVNCYFINNRQWKNVSLSITEFLVTVIEKIADQTDFDNHLTIHILNQSYLSKTTSNSIFNSTIIFIFFKKQADYWNHHVNLTLFKKICYDFSENSFSSEMQHSHMTYTEKAELDQQLLIAMKEDLNSTVMKKEYQQWSHHK